MLRGGLPRSVQIARKVIDNDLIFRKNNNTAPAIEKNRRSFRKTGNLNSSRRSTANRSNRKNLKSTGSGFGSSNLKTSRNSRGFKQARGNSFGSSRSNSFRRRAPMRRSFGRRR